jgi:hypothetical protein
MPNDGGIITGTLNKSAERVDDPVPLVFERQFAEIPEVEKLFARDSGGLVRSQMFQVTMESPLDFVTDKSHGANLIQIERVNHQGPGVEPDRCDRFHRTVMTAF